MSRCKVCRGSGLVFIRYRADDGYDLAACSCARGQGWRTPDQLRAYAATLEPPPVQIGRLEEFYPPAELKTLTTRLESTPLPSARPRAGTADGTSGRFTP